MQKRIYLASPYTSPYGNIRESRYVSACSAAAKLMQKGHLVFSPIAHSHSVAKWNDLPVDFDYWQNWCLSFIRHWATHFTILEISGWQKSRGIAVEKALANDLGLPIMPIKDFLEQEDD